MYFCVKEVLHGCALLHLCPSNLLHDAAVSTLYQRRCDGTHSADQPTKKNNIISLFCFVMLEINAVIEQR